MGGWRERREQYRRAGTVFRPTQQGLEQTDRQLYAGLRAEQYAYLWERVRDVSLPLADRVEAARELAALAQGAV